MSEKAAKIAFLVFFVLAAIFAFFMFLNIFRFAEITNREATELLLNPDFMEGNFYFIGEFAQILMRSVYEIILSVFLYFVFGCAAVGFALYRKHKNGDFNMPPKIVFPEKN